MADRDCETGPLARDESRQTIGLPEPRATVLDVTPGGWAVTVAQGSGIISVVSYDNLFLGAVTVSGALTGLLIRRVVSRKGT